jgi:threonine dehydratase
MRRLDRPTLDDVLAARAASAARLRRTPLLADVRLDEAVGRPVAVKAEHLQYGASFKFRGLDYKISTLGARAADGVLVVSSGNAAQAVALSAKLRGIPCTVVMPEQAVAPKVAAVEALGATIVRAGTTTAEMFAAADEIAADRRLHQVHPFDDADVVAGHASIGLELVEECPELGAVFVPASGGGLLAGVALAVKAVAPTVRVVGVQAATADSVRRSLAAGHPVPVAGPIHTIADALLASQVGDLTFELIRDHVDDIVVVDDEQICAAMRTTWLSLRQAVEPGGATALAGLMATEGRGGRDVAVLSGANVDLNLLAHVVAGGTAAAWLSR